VQTIVPENIESEANIPQQIIIADPRAVLEKYVQAGRIAYTENTPTNAVIGFFI
jgi:hypothetical protein